MRRWNQPVGAQRAADKDVPRHRGRPLAEDAPGEGRVGDDRQREDLPAPTAL